MPHVIFISVIYQYVLPLYTNLFTIVIFISLESMHQKKEETIKQTKVARQNSVTMFCERLFAKHSTFVLILVKIK